MQWKSILLKVWNFERTLEDESGNLKKNIWGLGNLENALGDKSEN